MPDFLQLAEGGILAKLMSGVSGALVSCRFLPGSRTEKFIIVIGGSALAYYGAPVAADLLKMEKAEGLVGFLLGLFGMAIVTKLYEGIQAVRANELGEGFTARMKKKLGGE